MTVRFVIGRAGSGKTSLCKNELRKRLKENPVGNPLIYLVPDQMTFQTEYDLITTPGLGGMIRMQVFSFTRLAWRVLQETGGISRYHISTLGLNMMIRRILESRRKDLKVFEKAAEKNGFIEQLEEMMAEFKRYCVTPADLEQKRRELDAGGNAEAGTESLKEKLHDFQLVYEDLERSLSGRYVDSEDYLRLLAEKIADSEFIRNAEIYIDGFYSFTPQEELVLGALFQHARRVTISLTLDREYEHPPHELNLYRMTGDTFMKLRELAGSLGAELEKTVVLDGKPPRYEKAPSLEHLERYYDVRPAQQIESAGDILLAAAVNRRAEVEGVAREVLKLVREKGYRFRDIGIFVRNMGDYQKLMETIFGDYEIPYFIDQKQTMLNHPLFELIRSSLDVIHTNWRYDPVFRCVKTDLFFPLESHIEGLREQMDQLENYVLARGIQGRRWKQEEPWTYRRIYSLEDTDTVQTDKEKEVQARINRLRRLIAAPLASFEEGMKRAKTGREYAEALYHYLSGIRVPEKIEKLRDTAAENGNLSLARQHDQVWDEFMDLLDQVVEIAGDDELTFDMFMKMIGTGLESMKFALVPPSLDQVLAGTLDRTRFGDVKVSFILGVNEGVLPAVPKEDDVISDEERQLLLDSGVQLAPGSREQLLDENFLIYLALTSPSERLWVSWPLADEEGKSLNPSVLIKRIKSLYSSLDEKLIFNDPAEVTEQEQLDFVTTGKKTLSYLAAQLQAWKRGYPVSPLWIDVLNEFITSEQWSDKARTVLSSLFYKNEAKKLDPSVSKELYGERIQASVSRMEQFNSCAFSQFASHGLKLKERQIFKLEAPDIGQLFHGALKRMSELLQEHGLEWNELTSKQCEQFSVQAIDELAPHLQGEILLSSNRHNYIKRKLQQVVAKASGAMSEHAKSSGFVPVGLEVPFGTGHDLPAITFKLPNGTEMELVGRIDRVDKAESSKGVLLRVVDYKSSEKALNLAEVYFGLALQMLTYLDIVLTHSDKWLGSEAHPAGVLYFHVHNPMINSDYRLPDDAIDRELFRQFKMKGLLVADEEAIKLMDNSLDSGHSDVVPAGLKKAGGFYSNSSVASDEEFDHLRNHVRELIKKVGTDITDGVIDIAPYKMKDRTPCTFCSYKSFCQFDNSLEENDYRLLKPEKDQIVLDKMRKKGGDDDDQ